MSGEFTGKGAGRSIEEEVLYGDPQRQLVTFALFTFNQASYVCDAVQSALAQDYSPLKIIISDDASTDDTFGIIEEEVSKYQGAHEIRLNRNPENLGIAGHFAKVVALATTNLIVAAAGDDVSTPCRTRLLVEEYRKAGTHFFFASSNAEIMGADGALTGRVVIRGPAPDDFEKHALGSAMPLGATEAFTKALFDYFGSMGAKVENEDYVIPFRAHLLGKVAYINRSLVHYRVGATSTSQDDSALSRPDLLARRAQYVAKQKIAVANMLSDLCFYSAGVNGTVSDPKYSKVDTILRSRLADLAVTEAVYRHRSRGRWFKAALKLLSEPRVLMSLIAEHARRLSKALA